MSERNLRHEMREMIEGGSSPSDATDKLVIELPAEWRSLVRPFIHRVARDLERSVTKQSLSSALRSPRERAQDAMAELNKKIYKLPDGTRIPMEDLTIEDVQEIKAGMRKHIGAITDHLHILDAVEDVMVESDAERLGDVPDWLTQVRERLPVEGSERGVLDTL